MKAKKKFGQNFLIDKTVLDKISRAVLACEDDLIIEIGPGRGALTKKILEKNCNVLAFEIDRDLIPVLNNLNVDKLKVVNNDFLSVNLNEEISNFNYEKLFIVGNLPYYITTPIIDYIIKSDIKHESLTIMVQLEVAKRFLATPGSKEYGYFTVFLQNFYNVSLICEVANTCFFPAPKVKSAVVQLTRKNSGVIDDMEFFDFIKDCFKEKRKTLRNNLKDYGVSIVDEVLFNNNLESLSRAEQCSINVFHELYEKICQKVDK